MKSSDRCYIPVLAGLGGSYCLVSVTGKRRGGDSNPRRLLTLHDFQSCTFDHSDTSPKVRNKASLIKDKELFKMYVCHISGAF